MSINRKGEAGGACKQKKACIKVKLTKKGKIENQADHMTWHHVVLHPHISGPIPRLQLELHILYARLHFLPHPSAHTIEIRSHVSISTHNSDALIHAKKILSKFPQQGQANRSADCRQQGPEAPPAAAAICLKRDALTRGSGQPRTACRSATAATSHIRPLSAGI